MDQWINWNVWIDFASEEMDSVHTHIHTHQIFTIDMWVTLSITPAVAMQCCKRNDFMSEKICYWIQLWLVVGDLDGFCSLAEGWAINLRLTSYWSRKLQGTAFIKLNRLGGAGEALLLRESLKCSLIEGWGWVVLPHSILLINKCKKAKTINVSGTWTQSHSVLLKMYLKCTNWYYSLFSKQ